MSLSDLGRLRWPSPLLDDDLEIDPYSRIAIDGDGLLVGCAGGEELRGEVSCPAAGVLRLRLLAASGDGPVEGSPMLVPDLATGEVELQAGEDHVRLTGAGVDARWYDDGRLESGAYRRAAGIGALAGAVGGAGRTVTADGTRGWIETFHLAPGTEVYGGGESFQGPRMRGRLRRLVNVETHGAGGLDTSYLNVPFFWSTEGWGIFVHTGGPVRADLGATHSQTGVMALEGDVLDLFVIVGATPAELLDRYQACTGRPGALPDWAFGVWSSRCSYLSEAELHDVADRFDESECPLDVVHVDAWVEGDVVTELTCNWSIDRARFPEGWVGRLVDRGLHVSLWHNPYVLADSDLATELEDRDLLVLAADGKPARTPDKLDRVLLDFTNPEATAWWKDQVRRVVAEEGNHAFKPDFAEELPFDAVLHDGRRGADARNEYALRYQRATHEAMVEATGSDQIALFCRSGTAGAQRFPCHWVGDTPSTWDGMETALRACLSLSLSGFGFVAHDVGGFWAPGSFEPMHESFVAFDPSGIPADVDATLYARWTQWGALSPLMRFHGTGRREPWAYPEPVRTVAIDACRRRDRLRAELVAAGRAATERGVPMMRPMVLAHPDRPDAVAADRQYLLGDDLLVAPVLDPSGVVELWVPPGRWEPEWGLAPLEGPGWAMVDVPLDAFPVWRRSR